MNFKEIKTRSLIAESREMLGEVRVCADYLSDLVDGYGDRSENCDLVVSFAALLSLQIRGLNPFEKNSMDWLFDEQNQSHLIIDQSHFGKTLCGFIFSDEIQSLIKNKQFLNDLRKTLADICEIENIEKTISNPLFVGWIHQTLKMDSTSYGARREKKSMAEIAGLTQWYTPEWIAEILANESISGKTSTFVDPACGTGHILIPALKKFISNVKPRSQKEAITEVLSKRLFGVDIEPLSVRLAGFSLYLTVRDLEPHGNFPLPRFYCLVSNTGKAHFGSYILGAIDSEIDLDSYSLIDLADQRISLENFPKKFDSIAANPPYLSNRLLPKEYRAFLKKHYFDSRYDLYTSFLDLCIRLLADEGSASFICQQSFLSIKRYEKFRRNLMSDSQPVTVAQLGPGLFATKSGEKVNSAIVTFKKNAEEKQVSFISRYNGGFSILNRSASEIEETAQAIDGYPILPWCPFEITKMFRELPSFESMETGIVLTNGLFTCNNKKFVKHFGEVNEQEKDKYVPYDKGGGRKWFYTTPYMLRWQDDGEEIRAYRKSRGQSRKLPGEEFYFKQGLTYSYIGPSGFKARLLSPGSIFDIASSAIFSDDTSNEYLLGFLNSSLVKYILGIINPTVNFQIGDLRKLPYIVPSRELELAVTSRVERSLAIARAFEQHDIQSPAFKDSLLEKYLPADMKVQEMENDSLVKTAYKKLLDEVKRVKKEECSIQHEIDQLIFELYRVPSSLVKQINDDPWVGKESFTQIEPPSLTTLLKQLNGQLII